MEKLDDKICKLLIKYGPDSHIDGHEEITKFCKNFAINFAMYYNTEWPTTKKYWNILFNDYMKQL